MVFLYTYLLGVVIILLMLLFVKWFRPESKEDVKMSIQVCLLSWISVCMVIYVLYDSWRIERRIRNNLPKKN